MGNDDMKLKWKKIFLTISLLIVSIMPWLFILGLVPHSHEFGIDYKLAFPPHFKAISIIMFIVALLMAATGLKAIEENEKNY